MKPLFEKMLQILREEWFLLVVVATIALIVLLFEAF